MEESGKITMSARDLICELLYPSEDQADASEIKSITFQHRAFPSEFAFVTHRNGFFESHQWLPNWDRANIFYLGSV